MQILVLLLLGSWLMDCKFWIMFGLLIVAWFWINVSSRDVRTLGSVCGGRAHAATFVPARWASLRPLAPWALSSGVASCCQGLTTTRCRPLDLVTVRVHMLVRYPSVWERRPASRTFKTFDQINIGEKDDIKASTAICQFASRASVIHFLVIFLRLLGNMHEGQSLHPPFLVGKLQRFGRRHVLRSSHLLHQNKSKFCTKIKI